MAFFLKAIGFSDDVPGFPFTPVANEPGHVVYTSSLLSWTIRPGIPQDDPHGKVTIFTCPLPSSAASSSNDLVKQMARNAMRRAKSLMMPGFLKCRGAVEYRDTVYIATEPCLPLKEVLESRELRTQYYGAVKEEYESSVAYGVSIIGEALGSLHQNRLVHGNVNCNSVFVVASSGLWRLFGLELVSSPDEIGSNSANCVFDAARRANVLEGYHCPPELTPGAAASSSSASATDAFGIDAWGMAGLLYESVGVTMAQALEHKLDSIVHTVSAADLRNLCRQSLPKSLHTGCAALTAPNPRMRKSIQSFLANSEFVKDCAFVKYMKGLAEILLLDVTQQVRLVESLADVVDAFPLRACLCIVLPCLGDLIRASAKPGSANGAAGVSMSPVVAPVLRIAQRTGAGEDFDTYVTPVLLLLFQSADVLIRYKLLVGAEYFGGKLASSALNKTIWPLYAKGFQYGAPSVREYSARALVHLAPHMSESVLGEQVPKALAQLQRDQDGALRANATIALHLISEHITPPAQRASVILMYSRPMLRDAFEPSRVAALRSLRGAMDCLTAKQLAEGVLPAVAPLTVDPTSVESRSTAMALIHDALVKLEANHKQLTAQQPAVLGKGEIAAAATSTAAIQAPGTAAAAEGGHGSWGWGLFNGSPPATPATTTTTAASARHFDAASPPASASVLPTNRSSPMPSAASSSSMTAAGAHPNLSAAVPAPMVSSNVGGSGWSDDDGGDDAVIGAATVDKKATQKASDNAEDDGWGDDDDDFAPPATTAPKKQPFAASTHASAPLSRGSVKLATTAVIAANDAVPIRSTGLPVRATPATATPPVATSGTGVASFSRPLASASPPALSGSSNASGASSPVRAGASAGAAASPPSSGPMKLRKKGSLGAARLD